MSCNRATKRSVRHPVQGGVSRVTVKSVPIFYGKDGQCIQSLAFEGARYALRTSALGANTSSCANILVGAKYWTAKSWEFVDAELVFWLDVFLDHRIMESVENHWSKWLLLLATCWEWASPRGHPEGVQMAQHFKFAAAKNLPAKQQMICSLEMVIFVNSEEGCRLAQTPSSIISMVLASVCQIAWHQNVVPRGLEWLDVWTEEFFGGSMETNRFWQKNILRGTGLANVTFRNTVTIDKIDFMKSLVFLMARMKISNKTHNGDRQNDNTGKGKQIANQADLVSWSKKEETNEATKTIHIQVTLEFLQNFQSWINLKRVGKV